MSVRFGSHGGLVGTDARGAISVLALALGSALSLIAFVLIEWRPGAMYGPQNGWGAHYPAGFGPFASVGVILFAMWLVAFVLRAVGLHRLGTLVLGLTIVGDVILFATISDGPAFWLRPPGQALFLLAALAVLAMVGPRVARGRVLRVGAVVLVIAFGAIWIFYGLTGWTLFIDRMGARALWGVLTASFSAPLVFLGSIVARIMRKRAWAVALLVLGFALAVVDVANPQWFRGDVTDLLPIVAAAATVLVLIGRASARPHRVPPRA